jgi:hypothetical protein
MLDCRKDAAGALRSAAAAVVDLVFPPLCLAYYRPLSSHDAICPRCWSDIDFIRAPLCARLGIPMPFDVGGTMISAAAAADPPDYDRARAVARFDGVKRELVHDLKFPDRHDSRRLLRGGWPRRGPSCWRARTLSSRYPRRADGWPGAASTSLGHSGTGGRATVRGALRAARTAARRTHAAASRT